MPSRHIFVELNDQHRLGRAPVEVEEGAGSGEGAPATGLVEDRAIEVLDGRGLEVEELDGGLHGLGHRVEEDHRQAAISRQRHHGELRRSHRRQGSFAARDQTAEVAAVAQIAVEAVTRPALVAQLGEALGDLGGATLDDGIGPFPEIGEPVVTTPDPGHPTVGQHHLEGEHVVRRGPVHRGVRPGGVVGDHPAKSGARRRRHIRPEKHPVPPEKHVELVEHHPGAHPHSPPFTVEAVDPARVPRQVHHQAGADRAPGQPGAGAAWDDLEPSGGGRSDHRRRLRRRPRKGHRQRFDPVERGIGGVEDAGQVIVRDLAPRGVEGAALGGGQVGHGAL